MNVLALAQAIVKWLSGKKTYLTGIAAVATGLANQDWNLVFVGLSAIFLRNAVANK